MGLLPSRSTLFKVLLFIAIYGSMIGWRRLQLATCKAGKYAKPMKHHRTPTNRTRTVKPGNSLEQTKASESDRELLNRLNSLQSGTILPEESLDFDINERIWNSDDTLFDLSKSQRAEFKLTLSVKADENRTVILAVVDDNLKDFALNYYILSIKKHSITNIVLICLDTLSQTYLQHYGISCLLYTMPDAYNHHKHSNVVDGSDFGSDQYYTRTNVKTLFVIETLRLNYHVLICDVDVIFLKHPMPYLSCDDCDLLVSKDREYWNSGFVFVKPTSASLTLYTRAWKLYNHYHLSHDQAYLNMAYKTMKRDELQLRAVELSSKQFPCGFYYFQEDFREFNSQPPCSACVIVHNNYMGSLAAKKYRFQENALWMVDTDGYYSSTEAKYLTYSNPLNLGDATYGVELHSLKSALVLGVLLNRIVVLPKFHCCNCKTKKCYQGTYRCSLLHMVNLKSFDLAFSSKYREASFFSHPLVPATTLSEANTTRVLIAPNKYLPGINATVLLKTSQYMYKANRIYKERSASSQKYLLKSWLSRYESPVLHIDSLYFDVNKLLNIQPLDKYDRFSDQVFQCTEYEQWEIKPFI